MTFERYYVKAPGTVRTVPKNIGDLYDKRNVNRKGAKGEFATEEEAKAYCVKKWCDELDTAQKSIKFLAGKDKDDCNIESWTKDEAIAKAALSVCAKTPQAA